MSGDLTLFQQIRLVLYPWILEPLPVPDDDDVPVVLPRPDAHDASVGDKLTRLLALLPPGDSARNARLRELLAGFAEQRARVQESWGEVKANDRVSSETTLHCDDHALIEVARSRAADRNRRALHRCDQLVYRIQALAQPDTLFARRVEAYDRARAYRGTLRRAARRNRHAIQRLLIQISAGSAQ